MLQFSLNKQVARLGKNKDKVVYHAVPVSRGKISFDDFCRELADGSTVDAADVKAVLSRMHTVITRLCSRGMIVDCGELGNFRPSFSSAEVLTLEEFSVEKHMRPAKLIYTPRVAFKQSLRSIGFERTEAAPESKPKGKAKPSAPKEETPSGGSSAKPAVGL